MILHITDFLLHPFHILVTISESKHFKATHRRNIGYFSTIIYNAHHMIVLEEINISYLRLFTNYWEPSKFY